MSGPSSNPASRKSYSIVAAWVRTAWTVLVVICGVAASANAQNPSDQTPASGPQRIGLYIDCKGLTCDQDFLRTDITFVNHIRDRHDADVHVLITAQPTAEGGTEATLNFIGQKRFVGLEDTLQYVSRPADPPDRIRQGLSQALKRGLVRYVSRTPLAEDLTVLYAPEGTHSEPSTGDRWNRWTFATTINGFVSGEEVVSSMSVLGSLSASRVTDAWKISTTVQTQYFSNTFEVADRTITSVQRTHAFSSLIVGSLNNHFSLGVRMSALSSRFLNQELTMRLAPALEYNVFNYRESTNRMLTFEYSIGGSAFDYEEATIFGRTSERLLDQRVLASLRFNQRWGSTLLGAEASHQLKDTRKRRGTIYGSVEWNLVKGFSLLTSVDVRHIADQTYLPARGASPEEILLRQRQLATSYSYAASLGLSYTFGSRFATIVNRRFAGSVGGSSIVQ